MSSPFLLIDGYNLMHAAGLARATYGPGDLARKRLELLVKLARRLSVEERKRCTVVFDAIDAPPNLPGRFRHAEMLVLFAEPGHEADEQIELLISQNSAPRRLMVVSSDHRLQNAIRKRRGVGIDSEAFLKRIESPQRQVGASPNLRASASDPEKDLEFWMREFESISPETIHEEVIAQSGESKSDWEKQVDTLQRQLQDPKFIEGLVNEADHHKPPSKPT